MISFMKRINIMKDINSEKYLAFPNCFVFLWDAHKVSGKTIAAFSGDGFYGDIDYSLWGVVPRNALRRNKGLAGNLKNTVIN